MSFIEEMQQLSAKYDTEHPPKDEADEKIEYTLQRLKKNISELIARGHKQISSSEFPVACMRTPEYQEIHVNVKMFSVDITWDIKEKQRYFLQRLKAAAAEEGIAIKSYYFTLEAMCEAGYDRSFLSNIEEYQGTYSMPKKGIYSTYYNMLSDPENWKITTTGIYEFSVL